MSHSSVSTAAQPTTQSRLAWRDAIGLRVAVCLGISLLALLLRWPNLELVPRLTDETAEVRWAIRIANGEILPLTHVDQYVGPLHPYLLAALLRVFGFDPLIPRAMMAVLGAALPGLVAWLAWGMAQTTADRRPPTDTQLPDTQYAIRNTPFRPSSFVAAVVAGALTATSFPLIVINSHLAWSNGLTPLMTTLALGVTWSAVVEQRGWRLVLAGFLWALALQTHPSVVALLPGVALWTLLYPRINRSPSPSPPSPRRRGKLEGGLGFGSTLAWLRTPWPWLAVGAFVLGYANMLWYNLTSQGGSVDEALNPGNAYTLASSLSVYLTRLGDLLRQLARMLGGAYAIQLDGTSPLLVTPMTVVYGVVALMALGWATRRWHTALLPMTALSGALLLPLVSHAYTALYDTRYIAFLLPLVCLAVGLAAGALVNRDWRLDIRDWGILVGCAVLVLYPLLPLVSYYRDSDQYSLTNRGLMDLARVAQKDAAQGTLVLIDRDIRSVKLGGGGDPVRALEHLMTLDGIAHQTARPDTINWYLINSEAPMLLVLSDATYATLAQRHNLAPTELKSDGFAAYRAPKGK